MNAYDLLPQLMIALHFRGKKYKEKGRHQNETLKTTSCTCFISKYKESICTPVLQRRDTNSKDYLMRLLRVYFCPSTPNVDANNNFCEDSEAYWGTRALLYGLASHALLSFSAARASLSVEELLLAPASILAVITGGEKSDCILMPPVVKSKNNMH